MLVAELAHHERQSLVDERVDVRFHRARRAIHAIHVHVEQHVGVLLVDTLRVVFHNALPVLPPVRGGDYERVLEAGVSHLLDGTLRARRPLRSGVVAVGLIAEVDHDVVFLTLDGTAHGLPELHGVVEALRVCRIFGVSVASGVMIFKDADEIVLLTLVHDIADFARGGRAIPTSREYDAHGVRAGVRDVCDRAGVLRVPLVSMVDSLWNELLARGIELASRNVKRVVCRLCRSRWNNGSQCRCANYCSQCFLDIDMHEPTFFLHCIIADVLHCM